MNRAPGDDDTWRDGRKHSGGEERALLPLYLRKEENAFWEG